MTPQSRTIQTLLAALFIATISQAANITGTVTNKTINKPAAGDRVVLIQLAGGMKESNTTTTDAHGKFTLELPDAGPHLIRVDHEKAGYFRIAPPGTQSVDVDVYDVAEKVQGVSTEANVMRIEADQQGLHVIQNYFVKNSSTPPRTQLSTRAYEIYLPEGAQIEGSAAMAPNGMPVASSPVPLGDKGHYAFVFPIRPGETRFQVSYRLPYTGSYKFTPKLAIPAENVAIMLPKSIKFTPGPGASFRPVDEDPSTQTYLIKNATPDQPLDFTIAGLGSMPRESQGQSQGQASQAGDTGPATQSVADQPTSTEAGSAAAFSPNGDTRPGGGLGNPIDTPDPLTKYRWWILGGLSLVLAAAAAFFLRKPIPDATSPLATSPIGTIEGAPSLPPHLQQGWAASPLSSPRNGSAAANSPNHQSQLLAALKEELFSLETERLEGKLADPEYAQLKSAFEIVLKRALNRQNA